LVSISDNQAELRWSGRTPDQNFAPDELLYYRVEKFIENGRVNGVVIRCPDTSVNRGKYSRPEHLLYAQHPKFMKWKAAQFQVRDVPPTLRNPNDGNEFAFNIEHDPTLIPEENYAHSEVRAYRDGQRRKNLPRVVESQLRHILAEAMQPAPLPSEFSKS
jgi:hypothetical protein